MPVAFDGFSIREYAAKMRTVDVFKCCPFLDDNHGEEDMSKERAEAFLPPITVTKFKLWSHELDRIKSNLQPQEETILTLTNKESAEEIPTRGNQFAAVPEPLEAAGSFLCPVCKVFEAASVNAVHAHVDRCLAHASREERRQMKKGGGGVVKAKSKAPKKRSIAEIFAVAPPIQTVEDEEDDQQLVDRNTTRMKAKKVKKRKKEKRVVLLEENKKLSNNNNNNNNKTKKKKIDGSFGKKENSCKLKRQTPVTFANKLHKKITVDNFDSATIHARTPNLKFLTTQKRKVAQTSKFIPKQKKPMFPARSILKNHVLCGTSTFYSKQGDSQGNTCGIQHSRRHVRFSGKDDILGPRKNGLSSFERNTSGNLFSDNFASSSEKDQSADSDKEAAPEEVDRRVHDVTIGTDNGTQDCSETGRNEYPTLLGHVGVPSFLRPHITGHEKAKYLPEKSVSTSKVSVIQENNLHMFNQGYQSTAREAAYCGIPRLISALEEPCVNTKGVTISRAFDSCGKMIDHVVHPIQGVSAMISKENTGAFFEPSIRNFILNENPQGRVQFLSQSDRDRISDRGMHYQSIRPPMDLIGGSYPFPQWTQRAVTFTERLLDDKFLGLPLNSHGELIQFSSRGGNGFDQLGKLNTIAGSSSSLPAYNQHFVERELPSDQLNLFPMQNYVQENRSLHLPDRLGVTYLGSNQRPDVHQLDFESRSSHSFHPLHSDLNVFNMSSSRCRQFDHVQNRNIGGMVPKETSGPVPQNMNQPTMRLMGKDVAIGKSSRAIHGFEDGKVWMDKEIIAEHCPSSNALLNSSLNKNFHLNCFPPTASAKLKETVSQSLGICSEQSPQSNLQMKSPEFRFPHPYQTSAKSKETVSQSFGICSEQSPQSNLQMKSPEFRFPHPYQNWQSSSEFEHGSLTASRSPRSNLLHFSQSPTSPAMFNGGHSFREPFISRTESLQSQLFGTQLPALSTPQSTYEYGIPRPPELGYKQNPPHFRKSTFDFPFLNPECRENVRPSWFQNSSKVGLPPWLLHATFQRNPPITAPQAFPSTASRHPQQIMPRTNIFNAPSMHHSSEISHSQVKSSPIPATTILPPRVPVIPEENPSSAMINMSYRNRMNAKGRMKPKALSVKEPYPCKRTKRLAVESTNPPNIIDLEVHEKSSVVAGFSSSSRNFINEMQSNFRALDLQSSRKQVSGLGCSLSETQKDGFETFSIESSKVEDVERSGPIKLSAGAKHIIKPTQNVDQDNCRPIHSTIPFIAVANDRTEPESQNKSTKIYKI